MLGIDTLKLYHAVSLSILVHLVLVLGLKVAGYEFKLEPEPIRQYVEFRSEQTPLSAEETKRVEKETRTRDINPSDDEVRSVEANRKPTPSRLQVQGQSPTNQNKSDAKGLGEKLRTLSPSENDIFMRPSSSATSGLKQQLQSFLPRDLEIGDIVALNSDQNLFFTFYRRMAEKVIWPWAQNVVGGFEKMKATGQLGSTSRAWITIIEVVLDENGKVVATLPMQLAGDFEIDNAPLRAFKQAKNFPNPPAEMVEEDGYIRIRYKFVVYYNPRGP